jgi:hypothetical protein
MKREKSIRLGIVFTLFAILFGALTVLISCEEPPPPVPDCELNGYGEVTVKNNTGYELKVDVTYTILGANYEKWLNHGGSYTYKMDKGTVYIWASEDGINWQYESYYLNACEDLLFTWKPGKKKSINSISLEISKDGEAIKTVSNFQSLTK